MLHSFTHNFVIEMKDLIAVFVFITVVKLVASDGIFSFKIDINELKLDNDLGIVCPNNRTKCKNEQTCCATKHRSYHCCRFPNAVCCPDKYHCCPEGTTCDSKRKRCTKQIEVTKAPVETFEGPMEWPVVEESPKEIKDQMCANNHTRCKDTQTCCITKHGSYHCCKFENAVCCSDKYHCCPEDSTCDLKRHRCIKSNSKLIKPMKLNVADKGENKREHDEDAAEWKVEVEATCSNNKTKCKDTKTCCITKRGNYYCCPHKNAVCCPDKYHCCPEGTTCDSDNNKCVNSSIRSDIGHHHDHVHQPYYLDPAESNLFHPFLSIIKLGKKCPGTKLQCPGHKKCCTMAGGKFGCCTFDKGICCPDMETCCPHDTQCDTKNKACISKATNLVPLTTNTDPISQTDINVTCPDKKVNCNSGETCCSVGYDTYGCCPFQNATCCSDKASCCPHNKKCDLKTKSCVSKDNIKSYNDVVQKESLFKFLSDIGLSKVCPDNHSNCGNKQTCCKISPSSYGCCPYDNGVCCQDMRSCCPSGYKCETDTCSRSQ